MEAGCEKIWLKGSGIFYKIYNIYFAPNCQGRIVATNCPAPNCPDTLLPLVWLQILLSDTFSSEGKTLLQHRNPCCIM